MAAHKAIPDAAATSPGARGVDRVVNPMDTAVDQGDLYSAARVNATWNGLPTGTWRPTRHLFLTQLGIADLADEYVATVDIV